MNNSTNSTEQATYYVIDIFPFPCFIHNEDGIPTIFKTYEEAALEATECQDGHVISFSKINV